MSIDPLAIRRHVEVLAADGFEGRRPGTAGEVKTLGYIVEQMKLRGLEPGNNGSWFQDVPLVETGPSRKARLEVRGRSAAAILDAGADIDFSNVLARSDAALDASRMVFVGYGIHAPDRGWDDLKDVDLTGRTAVLLHGVPPERGSDLRSIDFDAKVAEIGRRGGAGVLSVMPEAIEGEKWDAVVATLAKPQVRLDRTTSAGPVVAARIRWRAADRLFAAAGRDLADSRALAGRPSFKPMPLDATATVRLEGVVRRFVSKNVIARLPGAKQPHEHVLFLAHWDHLGRCEPDKPDPICNGAVDNASGVGGLLELAGAFAKGPRLRRSVLFLATTAEEDDLLGARHYVDNPVVPLADTVGGLGADTIATAGPADVVILGEGLSPDMDRLIAGAARSQGRELVAAPKVQGFFDRSDHYPFAAAGVPVLIATGIFAPQAAAANDRFFAERYHKPSDELDAGVRFDGAALDMELAYRVGVALANSRRWPGWRAGTPYAAARAAQRRRTP